MILGMNANLEQTMKTGKQRVQTHLLAKYHAALRGLERAKRELMRAKIDSFAGVGSRAQVNWWNGTVNAYEEMALRFAHMIVVNAARA